MTVGLAAATLNGWLNGTLATLYVELHTADPGAAGTTGVSAGSTTRVAVTHNTAAGASATISGTAPSWTNGGTSETISHLAYFTAATGGTYVGSSVLGTAQAWASGNTLTLNTNTWSVAPVAA